MRSGVIGDGGIGAWHATWPARVAAALPLVAQGYQAQQVGPDCTDAGLLHPPAAAGHGTTGSTRPALHPALGSQPLRGTCQGWQNQSDDPRPSHRRAQVIAQRSVPALYRRGTGADAYYRVQAAQGSPFHFRTPTHRPHPWAVECAVADRIVVDGVAGLRHPGAVLHAMGGGPSAGVGGPRFTRGARPGFWVGAAAASRHWPAAWLVGGLSLLPARIAVDGQRVRAPAQVAARFFRKTAPGGRHLAHVLGADHSTHAHHQLCRGDDRWRDGDGDAGVDASL